MGAKALSQMFRFPGFYHQTGIFQVQRENKSYPGYFRQPKIEKQHHAKDQKFAHTQMAHIVGAYGSKHQSCITGYNQLLPQISANLT